MDYPWFYKIPIWADALVFLAILLACLETTYRIGLWQRRRAGEERVSDRHGDVSLTAMLALLGLMLAFTYSFTVSRSDLRKAAVLEEITSAGTAFLRADLLDEPHRTTIRTLLLEYTSVLALDPEMVRSRARLREYTGRIYAKQAQIWPAIAEMAGAHSRDPLTNSMIQAITNVFDAHMNRYKAGVDRLPGEILVVLVFVAGTCLSVIGYSAGRADPLRRWRTTALALVLTAVMVMIVDCDRPLTGFVRTNQNGYIQLIEEMEAALRK